MPKFSNNWMPHLGQAEFILLVFVVISVALAMGSHWIFHALMTRFILEARGA